MLDKNLRQNISFKHQKGAVANLLLIVLIIVKYWIGHTTPPFHDIWTVRSKVICFGMPCWHILSTGRGTHPHLLLILTFVFTPSDIEKDILYDKEANVLNKQADGQLGFFLQFRQNGEYFYSNETNTFNTHCFYCRLNKEIGTKLMISLGKI